MDGEYAVRRCPFVETTRRVVLETFQRNVSTKRLLGIFCAAMGRLSNPHFGVFLIFAIIPLRNKGVAHAISLKVQNKVRERIRMPKTTTITSIYDNV